MANYVTEAELNTYLGTSGETALLDLLNSMATAYINSYLQVTTLNAISAHTEKQDYTGKNYYNLRELEARNLTQVNGSAVIGNVNFDGRQLTFEKTPVNIDNVFNKITFTYDFGFVTIPDDIKLVVCEIVGYLYNGRKTSGIKGFTQGQISVTYNDGINIQNILQVGLMAYKKNNIYSV